MAGLFMQGQYPLSGADLTNSVQVAGVRIKGGGFRPLAPAPNGSRCSNGATTTSP